MSSSAAAMCFPSSIRSFFHFATYRDAYLLIQIVEISPSWPHRAHFVSISHRMSADCLPASLPNVACCLPPLPLFLASSSALSSCLYPCPIQLAAWHFSDSDRPWAKLLFYIFFQLCLSLSLSLTFVLSHSFAFFFVSLYREYEESQVAKMLKQNEKSRPEPVNVMTGSVTSGPGSQNANTD